MHEKSRGQLENMVKQMSEETDGKGKREKKGVNREKRQQ